jgi:hypothetical protein
VDSDRVIAQRVPADELRLGLGMFVHSSVKSLSCSITKQMLSLDESADCISLGPGASAVLSADAADAVLPFGAISRNMHPDSGKIH